MYKAATLIDLNFHVKKRDLSMLFTTEMDKWAYKVSCTKYLYGLFTELLSYCLQFLLLVIQGDQINMTMISGTLEEVTYLYSGYIGQFTLYKV